MKLLHSHNDYWTTHPFKYAFWNGVNMFEIDIIHIGGKLMASHSWRPCKCLCRAELEKNYLIPMIENITKTPELIFVLYIEYKSGSKKINPILHDLLLKYKHPRLHYTISALNNTWYQKSRHIQAQQFMDLYKDELALTWESDLETQYEYERRDYYTKKWWMF